MPPFTLTLLARIAVFDGSGYAWLLLEMLLTLGIIGLVAWLVLRWASSHRTPPGGPITLLARYPLEPRRTLYLVSVGDRILLLGSSEAGLSSLMELSKEEVDTMSPSALSPHDDFASRLAGRLLSRRHKNDVTITSPAPPNAELSRSSSADVDGEAT